jgi:hypothetical protein
MAGSISLKSSIFRALLFIRMKIDISYELYYETQNRFAILFFWIIPVLACNFPVPDDRARDPFTLDATMEALPLCHSRRN